MCNVKMLFATLLLLLLCLSLYGESSLDVNENSFIRNEPNDKFQMIEPTNIEVSYDKDNFYIHASMLKNEDMVMGSSVSYETNQQADYLRVQVVVSPKDRFGYIYYAYPNGSPSDGIRNSDLNISLDWDGTYSYKNTFTEKEWIVDMVIPFNDMNYTNEEIHNWKLAFSRAYTKKYHLYSAPYTDIEMAGDYFDKGFDITLSNIARSNLNITTRGYTSFLQNNLNQENKYGSEYSGFDIAYNPSAAINLKSSFNPDYSEVPLDYEKDNYNLEFAPSLSENRYFFTEDYASFDYPRYIFYTRHIQQPEVATKLTGNLQNISYGFLYAKDEKLTDGGYVYNDGDQYIVANIKPKGDNWSFQISTLNRFNPSKGYNNSILQLSPMIYLTKSNRLMIDAYLSTRKEKNEASLNGLDYCVNYSHYAKKYTFDSYLYSTSKNFIADMGITNETGYSMLSYAYHYRFYTSQLRFLGFDNSCDYSFFNENGKMSYLYAKSSLSGSTMSGYSFKSIIKFIQDDFEGKIFTNPEIFQQFGWNNYKNIVITASVSFAHPLIYSLKDAYKLISYNASGNYTFMDRYKLAISWTLMNYLGLSTNEKETFDNNYQFLNGDVTLNIAKKLKSTTGIRYNNYNVHRFYGDTEYHYTDHLGVYANLLFKFNKYIELSGGYSYGADIINERTDESHNNFWSKLMVEYSF